VTTAALSSWWTVGWAVGAVVVLLVAILILAITALARKIGGEAQHLVTDLDSIASKTQGLHDVGRTNLAVRTITRCLCIARGGTPAAYKYANSPGWRE
jgi:predicted PurR-regulated permease PerM